MNGYHLVFKESNLPTEVPPVQSYACLSNESPSGMQWRSGDTVLPLTFGSCDDVLRTWPPDVAEQYKHQHLFPMSYQCYIQTGWSIEKIGSAWEVERAMEWFPAAVVREHLELQREIELLAGVVARGRA
ncbi:hypothetical protein Q3V30_22620 (plasmid) [Erwinia pyri]|uniref:Uncharacterized protein n=1 Tax=Erwinia pyri TaxID=3062598 RepID=A0AA50DNL7_9GAMM|nr:hypothetical protein [Erwinia sp. DE2]WLS81259.1 hypothetical protein Q3V30_22620 [Erwinia sp. DE2]